MTHILKFWDPHELCYRFMKVFHRFRKNIHGLIHYMKDTQEANYVDSFYALSEGLCRDIFPIIDCDFISEYVCNKNHSYDAPPYSYDDLQWASLHFLCLQHIDALMHDLGIHNIFTKSITKKLNYFISFKWRRGPVE